MYTEHETRFVELEQIAISRFLESMDFYVPDWLNDNEAEEYEKLSDEYWNS